MANQSFTLTGLEQVTNGLQDLALDIQNKAAAVIEVVAIEMTNSAKQGAPWTDRTGNARRSIHAENFRSDNRVGTNLGIGVTYGKYLETAHGGRFRIIEPVVLEEGPRFVERLGAELL